MDVVETQDRVEDLVASLNGLLRVQIEYMVNLLFVYNGIFRLIETIDTIIVTVDRNEMKTGDLGLNWCNGYCKRWVFKYDWKLSLETTFPPHYFVIAGRSFSSPRWEYHVAGINGA